MPDGKRSQLCSKKLFEPKFVNCLEVLGITKEPDHYDSNISATTSNLKLVSDSGYQNFIRVKNQDALDPSKMVLFTTHELFKNIPALYKRDLLCEYSLSTL